jgi:peptidylprolyl isomerase
MKKYLLLIIGLLPVLLVVYALAKKPAAEITSPLPSSSTQETTPQSMSSPSSLDNKSVLELPKMEIDKNKKYTAVLTTSQGEIKISLNAKQTPVTVNNFVYLARKSFYNNTVFHRIIKGFMIQGGDPNGDGTGGPGYKFKDEAFEGEYTRGTIAMANAGPNTNGSQFFIMHQDYGLPKNYVIFGKVVEGLDVVDKIAESPVKQSASGENSQPANPTIVKSVEIIEG